MTDVWPYFAQYFKTCKMTGVFIAVFVSLTLLKYGRTTQWKRPEWLSAKRTLFLVLGLGVLLRVSWILFSSHTPKVYWYAGMQEWDMINAYAADLTRGVWFVNGDGSSMFHRPIGYPLALGLIYKLFGVSTLVLQVFHLILFVASVYFIYQIAEMIFGERVALLASLLFSIFPTSIYSVVLSYDEHLFLPLWYGGLYLLLREVKGKPVRWSLLWYGLIFGASTITRTHSIFMPFVVALAYLLMRRSWKQTLGAFFVVALVMQLLNLPWIIRNYRLTGVPVLYTATSQFLYRNENSTATPEGDGHVPVKGEAGYSQALEEARLSGNPGLYHAASNREMKKWILGHPTEFLQLGIAKVLYFMGWNRTGVWPLWFQFYEGSYDPARPVPQHLKDAFEEVAYTFYYSLLFFFLCAVGRIFAQRRQWEGSRAAIYVVASCLAFWLLEHMIIYADRKYRFPIEPLMIVFASFFIDHLVFTFRYRVPAFMKKRRGDGLILEK